MGRKIPASGAPRLPSIANSEGGTSLVFLPAKTTISGLSESPKPRPTSEPTSVHRKILFAALFRLSRSSCSRLVLGVSWWLPAVTPRSEEDKDSSLGSAERDRVQRLFSMQQVIQPFSETIHWLSFLLGVWILLNLHQRELAVRLNPCWVNVCDIRIIAS